MKRAIVVAMCCGGSIASAQPAASAQAEVLFDAGKQLMAQKHFADACAKFDSSQQLEANVNTLLNLADCREKTGQLATAWGMFLDAEHQLRDSGKKKLETLAKNRAAKLEPRVSKLAIKVPAHEPDGLTIMLGDHPVTPGTWNTALPVDGGTYAITASAPHAQSWSISIAVGNERDAKVVDVPVLVPASAPPPSVVATEPSAPDAVASAPSAPDQPEEPVAHHSRVPAIVASIATLAVGGVALGFELSSRSLYSQSQAEANDAVQTSEWQSANDRYHVAQGLGIAAVVGAGVSVWLWIRSSGSSDPASAMIVPVVGPNGAGLAITGAWR
ncbi:MAG TPA: hypothetical protein VH143_34645 [Kofleriaceae bacterium]|jgi:hypothetical protein|nr:hypothetical protein [Kofleriaceae bacterium]